MPDESEEDLNGTLNAETKGNQPPRPAIEIPAVGEDSGDETRNVFHKTTVKPNHWGKSVEAWCAVLLVCITGYYAVQAGRQATASEKAANAAKSAADTADATLRHVKSQDKETSAARLAAFKVEQRAYVAYTYAAMSNPPACAAPGLVGKRVCADIHFVNSGRTPAIGLHLYRHATFGKNAEKIIKTYRVPPRDFGPNGDLLGNVGDKWITAPTDPVDDATSGNLINATVSLYVYGVAEYYDIFGDYHETGFCVFRVPGSNAFMECEFGNWFDRRPTYHK